MYEILEPYLQNAVFALVGMFVMWFPNRKKESINNQQSIVDLYQDSLTDLKTRYEEKYQDLKMTFENKLENVMNDIDILKKSLEDWKKKYFNLKKDFDNYKKEHQ